VARDRKRAKQRRERGAAVARRRRREGAGADPAANGAAADAERAGEPGAIERADLPGALGHAGAESDEFDAALVRGAGGVPLEEAGADTDTDTDTADEARTLDEREIEREAEAEGDVTEDQLQELGAAGGARAATPEQASGAPIRSGNRVVGFVRASWAELQRVQWPDRRQTTQATAVVIGFVAIAGAYLGLADVVAKEIVEFIL